MAEIYEYYEPSWRKKKFRCSSCGWEGRPGEETQPELFEELMHYECKSCDNILIIVSYPTLDQIRVAAESGNSEAAQELRRIEGATE